ncbi:MAG: TRAP transporter substrate-binding protein [Spirochaetes bacterium]|nr:TRAP transporter substrate-binding protein [Spirochaetota bacterium]
MKNICLFLVLTTVVLTGYASGKKEETSTGEIKPVEFKLGHVAEPDNPYALGAGLFADRVKERTGGKVTIKMFPSSQLGTEDKLIEGLVIGSVDFALTTTAVLGQFEEKLLVFGFPYIFRNREHAYKALDTIGMELGKNLEKKGIKVLGYYENGVRHMINNKRKILVPDDMKGLKMRVMPTQVYIELMKALGSDPTPMNFGEVYSACQTGIIDGLECPAVHIWQRRFYEVNKYVSLTAHTYESEPMMMSMKSWQKVPENVHKIMEEAMKESLAYQRKLAFDKESEYFQKIKDTGKTSIDPVDTKLFAEKTKVVWEKLGAKVGMDLINKIQSVQ